jgi:hypothetical protein
MKSPRLASAAAICSLFLAFAAASPAHAQSVKSDYDKATDFAKYKTFSFKKGTDAPTPFAQQRIEGAIAAQLKERGIVPSDSPDLYVFTHTKVSKEQRVDVTSYGYGGYPGWGGWGGGFGSSSVMVTDVPMGTVMVDMVDAKTDLLVWRGVATDTLSTNPTPEKSAKRINKAMAKLFNRYPVPPAPKK